MTWFDLVLKISAILGGALAILTFWRTAKVRRAEWLSNLHAKFFEGAAYKQMRQILDSDENDPELVRLREDVEADRSSKLVEEFVDYLNFFEFVASLRRLGQLKSKEISMLFDYYLRSLRKHHFVRSYVRKHGFEGLEALLKDSVEGKKW